MPGQLNLFRSRKQRGIAPPAPSEYQLHCMVVDTVRRWRMPGWIFTHIASRGSWLLDDPETRAGGSRSTNESPCYCKKLAWRCASRKKGRLNDKRPKSREETPKEGSGSKIATACVSY